jgi:hypothetical protein
MPFPFGGLRLLNKTERNFYFVLRNVGINLWGCEQLNSKEVLTMEQTKMETKKEECVLCGSEGIRTTLFYGKVVDVSFKCPNWDCEQSHERAVLGGMIARV